MTIQARIHPTDGRIAQVLWLDGGNYEPSGNRWVCVTAPHGLLTVNRLHDQDVTDWLPLTTGDTPT